MAEFKVVESFVSINGEGQKAGQLAMFVRFQGCNLNCSYCDTKWANRADAPYRLMTEEEICQEILSSGVSNVTLTGGEPLMQKDIDLLLTRLAKENSFSVEIETNGSMDISPYDEMEHRPSMTLDYKLESSGMESFMKTTNYDHLKSYDTIKFVCGSMADLVKAKEIIDEFDLVSKCHLYLSPVFGQIDPAEMVEYMKEHQMNGVNLQLQLHKFIWDPEKKGV